uniref:Putative encapsulating protein for peroxidase n=1 Tax=viral metagenome TaxID=1070528 RepID=A0A6M3K443_9ZZZZ
MDYVLNGAASGDVAQRLLSCGWDPRVMRPFIGRDGKSYITQNKGTEQVSVPLVGNSTTTLRKDEWIHLDDAVVKAARTRLHLVADLRAAGLTYTIPNGMGKTVLQTETQSDITDASISMDGLTKSQNDRPLYELTNLPLPILHKDFQIPLRQLQESRNGGSPLDTSMAELAGRKVAEAAEKLAVGVSDTYAFGGGTIYGLANYTNALTKTITAPTASGWTGATLVQELLAMRYQSQAAYHYGPWMIYTSPSWDAYLDDDYSTAKGDNTLRERIKKIGDFQDVRTLDYLTDYDIVMVQMTSDVVREVIGMDITTVQWDTEGGFLKNFKVMCIMVPQVRMDQNSRTGIVIGAVA